MVASVNHIYCLWVNNHLEDDVVEYSSNDNMGTERSQGDQCGRSQANWKNTKIRISLTVLSQLLLKYAYTLDVLIHQFVLRKFSNGTLMILLNF